MFARGSQTKEKILDNVRKIMQDKGDELTKVRLSKSNVIIAKRWRLPMCMFKTEFTNPIPWMMELGSNFFLLTDVFLCRLFPFRFSLVGIVFW